MADDDYLKPLLDLAAAVGTKTTLAAMRAPEQIANTVRSGVNAATLPGDVVTGRVDPMSDEGVKRAVDLAGSMMLGGAGAEAPAGSLRMFAGRNAKTADLAALQAAEKMASDGAERRAIWDATGWFQGADGKWRFEIPDNSSAFHDLRMPKEPDRWEIAKQYFEQQGVPRTKIATGQYPLLDKEAFQYADHQIARGVKSEAPMSTLLEHAPLYENYPKAGDLPVSAETSRSLRGSFSPIDNAVTIARAHSLIERPSEVASRRHSTALHELQHYIQTQEGFAPGANQNGPLRPGVPAWDIYQGLLKRMQTPLSHEVFSKAANYEGLAPQRDYDVYLKMLKKDARKWDNEAQKTAVQEAYRRSAGEVEARNVQARMAMTPEERAARPPWETQDVPDDQQIVQNRASGGHVPYHLPVTSDDPNEVMRRAITYSFAIARMYGKADGGPVDGYAAGGKALAEAFRLAQKITSADTSIKQVPALFKSKHFEVQPGYRNLDIGGGRYDLGTEFLRNERGIDSHVYDPFNRPEEHNERVLQMFRENPADTVTAANVLNVIQEPEARAAVVQQALDLLRPGGRAYFGIYEGNKAGTGLATSKGWQENRPAASYLNEIQSLFPDASRRGNILIAPKPERADGGAALLQDEHPTSYLPNVGRQVMAEGGDVSAPITDGHTITLDDLIGRAPSPTQQMGAYTDAGGQAIAAPFVTGMSGGYPVYALPSASPAKSAEPTDVSGLLGRIFGGERLGFAEGGAPEVEDALRVARETQDREAMSHPVGVSGSVEFAPVRLREPLSGYEVPLGSIPKESAPAANAMLDTAERFAPYAFGPAAGSAYDMAVGAKEGSMGDVAMGAFGLPGKSMKAAGILGSTLVGGDAEAGPLAKALNYTRRLTERGFYSPAAEALAGVKQEKGRVGDFLNAIRGRPGVSKDELAHAGIESAFAPDQSVTRDQLMDYLHGKLPQIQETVYGNAPMTHRPVDITDELVEAGDAPTWRGWQGTYELGPRDQRYVIHDAGDEHYLHGPRGNSLGEFGSLDAAAQFANARIAGVEPPKFADYALPEGNNYREVLLHVPPHAGSEFDPSKVQIERVRPSMTQGSTRLMYNGREIGTFGDDPVLNAATGAYEQRPHEYWVDVMRRRFNGDPNMRVAPMDEGVNFRSSHWTQPNVLAHLRMSDRDRALHIDEIQSDWGQAGRDKGFKDPAAEAAAKEAYRIANEEAQAARSALLPKYHAWQDSQADAALADFGFPAEQVESIKAGSLADRQRMPVERQLDTMMSALRASDPETQKLFAKDLAAIRAAEQRRAEALDAGTEAGKGLVPGPYVTSTEGWTDLALKRALREAAENNFDKLVWTPGAEHAARYDLATYLDRIEHEKEGDKFRVRAYSKEDPRAILPNIPQLFSNADEIEKHYGKEVAKKVISGEGGPPLKETRFNKDVKTISGEGLSIGGQGMLDYYDKIIPTRLQKLLKKIGHDAQIEKFSYELPQGKGSGPVMGHSLALTPEMREAIMKGLPAFRRGGEIGDALAVARGIAA